MATQSENLSTARQTACDAGSPELLDTQANAGHRYALGPLAQALLRLPGQLDSIPPLNARHRTVGPRRECGQTVEACRDQQPHERRQFPRRDSQADVSVRCPSGQETAPGQVEWQLHSSRLRGRIADIGMQGIAFHLPEPIEVGETITLRLSNDRRDTSFDTTARVIRATKDGRDGWKLVCRFVQKLTFEQLHELGRHLFTTATI